MQDRNEQNNDRPDDRTGKGHGSDGNDKAPGEETAQDNDNFVADTQRGKNKVDGDPSKETDQPVDQK
jgi:hypothetical protein